MRVACGVAYEFAQRVFQFCMGALGERYFEEHERGFLLLGKHEVSASVF